MSNPQIPDHSPSFIRELAAGFFRALPLFILLVLPFVPAFLGYERVLQEEYQKDLSAERHRLLAYTRFYGDRLTPMERVGDFLANLASRHENSRPNERELANRLRAVQKSFPGIFEFALFDRHDQLLRQYSDLAEFHPLLASAAFDLRELRTGNSQPFQRNRRRYAPLFGMIFSPKRRSYHQNVGSWVHLGRERAYFFSPRLSGERPWFIAWISIPDAFEDLAVAMTLTQTPCPIAGSRQFLVDVTQPLDRWQASFGQAGDDLSRVILGLGRDSDRVISVNGFHWTQIFPERTKRVIICAPSPAIHQYQIGVQRFARIAGPLLIVLLLIGIPLTRRAGNWSIQSKLVLLFLYAAAVPIGLLVLAAQSLYFDHLHILEKRLFKEQDELLQEALRRPYENISVVEDYIRRTVGGNCSNPTQGPQKLEAFAQRLEQVFPVDGLCLYDEKGNVIFRRVSGYEGMVSKLMPLIGTFISKRIALFNNSEQGGKESAKEQMIMASIEMMGLDLLQFSYFFDPPDTFSFAQFGKRAVGMISNRFLEANGYLRSVGLGLWGDRSLRFLERRSRIAFQEKVPHMVVTSAHQSTSRWQDVPFSSDFPSKGINLEGSAMTLRERRVGATHSWLITGIPGSVEFGDPLLAVASNTGILQEIYTGGRHLGLIALSLVGMALLVGVIISRNLLGPVRDLARGLVEVKARNFRIQIPVRGSDELAALATAFNRMVEGMADLEIGKIVHETFFPTTALTGDGWQIYGQSVSASRVGGDYFDYFVLPDGRWLIIIGDVSGHGVAAALVVAMAKALTTHPDNPPAPGPLLGILNNSLAKTLQRKRLMSCWLGIFDPRTGDLTGSNAGHNYPYSIQNGVATHISFKGVLLGIKQNVRYAESTINVSQAGMICFYSDGVVEAETGPRKQIGYTGFEKALPSLQRATASESVTAIWDWFSRQTDSANLADDVTIVILQPVSKGSPST